LKVLAVTNMYPTEAEPWFGCFVKDQMDGVRAAGVDVDVISFDGRRDKREYFRAALEVRRRVEDGKFDVVHAHYGLTGGVAAVQRMTPVVTTIWGTDAGYVWWQGRVSWVVARLTTPIFVSRHNAARLGLPHAPVIPSGIDTTFFSPGDRSEARRELGLNDVPHVLFPGNPDVRRKRFDLFKEACAIVGRSRQDLRTIALRGYSRDETRTLMNAADVVLMTSDWEGSPLAIKEALACGTPVVSVPVGDVAEVVDGLPACEIVDRDPQALAHAVSHTFARTVDRNSLRRRAETYDQKLVATQLISAYEAAAANA
jgi:glycosyltransferase involved in cell wall biosynthesis